MAMKWHKVIQNSDEWFTMRAGIATASSFDKILTPSGKRSTQADAYANKLITELMLNRSVERKFSTFALEWGEQYEDEAADLYAFDTNATVIHGGFCTNDAMTIGCSPDVIVKDHEGNTVGIAEIKCPENPTNHVEFLLLKQINSKYTPQVQGQLLVTGLDWCDWYSYHPELPPNLIRTYRDDKYISLLGEALEEFEETVQKKLKRLQTLGHINEIPVKKIKQRKVKTNEKIINTCP